MTPFIHLFVGLLRVCRPLKKYSHLTLATLLLLAACSDVPTTTEPEVPGDPGSIAGTLIFPGSVSGVSLDSSSEEALAPSSFSAAKGSLVPGEVIIKFSSEVQLSSLSAQGLSLQRTQTAGLPRTALYRAEGLNERETLNLIEALNARPDIVYAEPNWVQTIKKTPNDEFYPFQWHYEAMNLPAAWDIEDGSGSDVVVAVIDSGSIPHPDLQGVLLSGYDFVSDPANAADGDGYDPDPTDLGQSGSYHGAHVMGTVAASTDNRLGVAGVSWGAKIVPIRALGSTGYLFDVVNAVLWAAGERVAGVPNNLNPAQVINLSLGGEAPCSQFAQDAFDIARAKGSVVVVAAGNENTDVGFSTPANCDGVVAVGATGPQNTRAPYSNYGAGIDVMAPGGDINQALDIQGYRIPAGVLSTVQGAEGGPSYSSLYDGTSMAAPHISGLVALMLAKEPNLDPDTVLARLKASAKPLSASECGRSSGSDCGAGLVNAAAALGGASDLPPQPETERVNTYVIAFHCTTASCTDFNETRSGSTALSATQLAVPFRIESLTSGTYRVVAWQDLNDNIMIDDNEPFGVYPANLTLGAGQAFQGADIYLEAFTPQAVQRSDAVRAAVEKSVGSQ